MDILFIKHEVFTEQIVIGSHADKNIFLIGGQLKINTFSFQTFRRSLQKQLIINVLVNVKFRFSLNVLVI